MEQKQYLALLHRIWISQSKMHSIFWKNTNYKEFYLNLNWNTLKEYWFLDKQISSILSFKDKYSLDFISKKIKQRNVKIYTINNSEYPKELKNIINPPYIIYVRWKISNKPKLSIVWTRKMTSYWKKSINFLVKDLVKYFTIVSWWADWCDTEAHKSTLKYNWNTISVIWTGIDIDYPVWNKVLYDDIIENNWAIISIFPFWEYWNTYNFPVRNEIVAWLWVGVIVIEAQEKSGTFITANLALDLWKDLFVVPWDIFSTNSSWCNVLIKRWLWKLISNSNDILEEFNINISNKSIDNSLNKINISDDIEREIYNILMIEKFTINELKNKINIDIATLSFKLSMMEINWLIKKTIWWKYEVF